MSDPLLPPRSVSLLRTRGYPNPAEPRPFWRDVFAWSTSVTPRVLPRMVAFGLYGVGVVALYQGAPWGELAISHVQYTGAVLVLLLVLRTNASYDRWWEARKLWGGIVNQSRNLAVRITAHVRGDEGQRRALSRWVAAFPHACKRSLRGQQDMPELDRLLGEDVARLDAHRPSSIVACLLADLRVARDEERLTDFESLQMDREAGALIDHIGACERILKTPLPLVHRVKLRRFIIIYLAAFPFVVVGSGPWLCPLMTMLVAYPLLAIDQMAQELESPFAEHSLSHLPLDTICATIEKNVLGDAG